MGGEAKSWIVPVSFIETIRNWPTKAGNHVPYEQVTLLCECVRCVPVVCESSQPVDGVHEPQGRQRNAGVRRKLLLCSRINGRRALPALITVVFYWKSKNTGKPAPSSLPT